jgi:peroxiredoxin
MKRLLLALAATAALSASPAGAAGPPAVARPVEGLTLKGLDGKDWSPGAQKGKLTVLVFLSCECPMSNGYIDQLNELAAKYRDKGVTFAGAVSGKEESAADLRKHAREYKLRFPLLKDEGLAAAKALGAKVYPEAFVLDAKKVVRYRGRIDDGYSARLKPRQRVGRRDLQVAIDELLAGKPVGRPETTAYGCPIPGTRKAAAATAKVTYYKDVLPILQANCQQCHRPGQVGPFSLMTYKQAVRWADDLVGETKARRMPPWKPTERGVFTNERSLTDAQLRTLQAWVDQGMAAGNAKDAPPAPKFTDGWKLGKPDLVLEMPSEAVIAASGRDLFHAVVFPTNLPEDKYIAAVEVQPGNPRVVHHTIQLIDTRGRARKLQTDAQAKAKADDKDRGPGYSTRMGVGFLPEPGRGLGGWAPGLVPQKLPAGVGLKLPKGADIVMQIHYHRTGKEERDKTKIGLYFQKGEVKTHFQAIPVPGLFLSIPAGKKDHKVQTSVRLTDDLTLYYLVPHMHLLGKKIELTAQVPGGKEEPLITIKEWDYNWQEMYQLKKPRKLPKGTVLRVKAVYDNSADNPLNPHDPPKAVRFGEQTTNEMCFVFCGVSSEKPGFPKFTLDGLFRLRAK